MGLEDAPPNELGDVAFVACRRSGRVNISEKSVKPGEWVRDARQWIYLVFTPVILIGLN
jgi:hypothetical protein